MKKFEKQKNKKKNQAGTQKEDIIQEDINNIGNLINNSQKGESNE